MPQEIVEIPRDAFAFRDGRQAFDLLLADSQPRVVALPLGVKQLGDDDDRNEQKHGKERRPTERQRVVGSKEEARKDRQGQRDHDDGLLRSCVAGCRRGGIDEEHRRVDVEVKRDADDGHGCHRAAGYVELRTLVDAAPSHAGDVDRHENGDQQKGRQPASVRRKGRLECQKAKETQVDVGFDVSPKSSGWRNALSHSTPAAFAPCLRCLR